MDVRPLAVNRDIYHFETRIYALYDNLPAKHRHTLSEVLVKSAIEMRHYCNLACRLNKASVREKAQMFSMALVYCADVQDSLDHLFDMNLMNSTGKSSMDVDLEIIRVQLSKLVASYEKESQEAGVSGGNK